MISERDVIKVCMPYPKISSVLALEEHYYICCSNVQNNKILFKCQSKTAALISRIGVKKYNQDFCTIRNSTLVPFTNDTAVDKNKIFDIQNTLIPLCYLSSPQVKSIPISIYNPIYNQIMHTGSPRTIHILKSQFVSLNPECQ